ncbi:MAG: GAF and ANTAR domain-containing protein [Actinomycetota bacterium]|jgi:GAF domain-containing protein
MTDDPEVLEKAVRTLSRLLLSEETLEATHGRVASLACRTLPACDFASVTMINDGRPSTPVQTNPLAADLDSVQYRARRGPCLEAYAAASVVREKVTESAERWPEFTAVATQAGVRSVLAVPLVAKDQPLGALNLYSKSAGGYDHADEETAVLFSRQAAVACANAEIYWRTYTLTEHLREALESRDVIGQAKGILMARRGCTAEAAFEALRKVSQQRNIKLRDIAAQVVYLGDLEE